MLLCPWASCEAVTIDILQAGLCVFRDVLGFNILGFEPSRMQQFRSPRGVEARTGLSHLSSHLKVANNEFPSG